MLRLFFAGVLFFTASALRAIEPWADATLPVKTGLALWLDAAREAKARGAAAAALDGSIWHDGSGHARHARPTSPATAPQTRPISSGPVPT